MLTAPIRSPAAWPISPRSEQLAHRADAIATPTRGPTKSTSASACSATTPATPILKVIKEAEQRLLDTRESKSYLGSAGDKRFAELLRPILLGPACRRRPNPRGCGRPAAAARYGLAWAARAGKPAGARVPRRADLAQPSADHPRGRPQRDRLSLLRARAGRDPLRGHDRGAASGEPGDIALLHGCCHNPTGADLDDDQWREVAKVVSERGLVPFIDIAYQGFGRGLDEQFGVRSCSTRATRSSSRKLRQEF